MKLSKKILLIILSSFYVATLSAFFSAALHFLFAWSFWGLFFLNSALIYSFYFFLDYYKNFKNDQELKKILKENRIFALENIQCQHCRELNTVFVNLENTEFQCQHCQKPNAIYVKFEVAAQTVPQ